MLYLVQVTVYSALLYSVYLLVLKNRAPHSWNRVYLLLCATLPLPIPFIKIPAIADSAPINTKALTVMLPEINVFTKNVTHADNSFDWFNLVMAVYLLGALALLLRSIVQYISFKRFVRQNNCEEIDHVKVLLNTNAGPGSFLDYIFLPDDKIDAAIFDHELAHIRLKHSSDILFMRLMQTIFWPNVVLYLISKELKIVHEFQADAEAIKNKEVYISALLNDTFSTNQFSLSHTFFYHPLKRRIMMLQKSPLSRTKLRMVMLKTVFLSATLLTGVVYLQNATAQISHSRQTPGQPQTTVYDTINAGKASGHSGAYNYADVMPRADYKLSDFLARNMKYPESARKAGIEGRVIVKFIVDEAGNITNPVIVRGIESSLDAEALRAVSQLPPWMPGKQNGKNVSVYFTLPIVFSLGGEKTTPAAPGEVKAVPNPASGSFTVQGTTGKSNDEDVLIEVTDLQGNAVYHEKAVAHAGSLNAKLQLPNSAQNGMYVVNVRSVSLNKTLHVLIQK